MSRRSRRVGRAVASALAVSALAAPAAGALPCEFVCGSATPGSTVTRTIDGGFDWGSAGLGAGAGAALVLLSLGGVRAGSRAFARPAESAAKPQS